MQGQKRTTIDEIAAEAGVSKTTVSRYINGKYDLISKKTQNKIQQAIKNNNYQPNDVARLLRSNQTRRIGVIISDMSTPFASALMTGISKVLDQEDYVPLFVNADNDFEIEKLNLNNFLARGVDGLLVNSTSYHNEELIEASKSGKPIVLCDRIIANHNFSLVTASANDFIIHTLAHLKEEGFAKPFLFTQEIEESSTRKVKHDLFLKTLNDYYPELTPGEQIKYIDIDDSANTSDMITEILSKESSNPVAFIGMNSVTTLHLLSILKTLNVNIPKQVGICGPDDWSWGQKMDWANLIAPGITTSVIPSYDIGYLAAHQLMEKIKNPDLPNTRNELSCELIVRSSTSLKK